jgi:hypothetical protein
VSRETFSENAYESLSKRVHLPVEYLITLRNETNYPTWDDFVEFILGDWSEKRDQLMITRIKGVTPEVQAAIDAYKATWNLHHEIVFHTQLFGKNYAWYRNKETGQISLHLDLEVSE